MKLPKLGAALDKAIARHVDAALAQPAQPTQTEDFAAGSRAEVTTPKGPQR